MQNLIETYQYSTPYTSLIHTKLMPGLQLFPQNLYTKFYVHMTTFNY